jgi:hypothetical protein
VPFHQFEDQGFDTVGILQAVDGGDVWMIQRGQRLRFALKPGDALRVCRERVGELTATACENDYF